MMLHQITSAELSSFETKRRTQGVRSGTIRRDLACLSSLLTSCVDWEWIDANVVPAFLKRRAKRGLKEAPPRTRYLTTDEEPRLIAAASPANMRNKNGRQAGKWTCAREAIILNIDTGLRREELFSLRWPQIDLERGVIITTTLTKSGRARMVPLPERSRTVLGTISRRIDTDYVFVNPSTDDRFMTMDNGLHGAMRRAKITDLRWHDLRRTAGCRWLQRDGKTIAEVSLLLGHSSVKVTEDRRNDLMWSPWYGQVAFRITRPGNPLPGMHRQFRGESYEIDTFVFLYVNRRKIVVEERRWVTRHIPASVWFNFEKWILITERHHFAVVV